MPSSGSTTSRIASSTSSTASQSPRRRGLARAASARRASVGRRGDGLRRRVLPRHPAQQRALDPGRVLRDAGERDRVLQHLLVRLDLPRPSTASAPGTPRAPPAPRPTGLPTTRSVSTEADAWLIEQPGPRTTRPARPPSGHPHPQRDLVAAGRVDVVHLGVERLPQPAAVRVLVVVQDDLLVHRLQLHPKTLFTCSSPSTRASTSAGVVYR